MAYVIAASCVACGDCRNACREPAAIVAGSVYRIDPAACTECGICVDVCLSGSIYAERREGISGP